MLGLNKTEVEAIDFPVTLESVKHHKLVPQTASSGS